MNGFFELLGNIGEWAIQVFYPYRFLILGQAVAWLVALLVFAWVRGWFAAMARHPGRTASIGLPILAVSVPLTIYAARPLIERNRIDEASPLAGATRTPTSTPSPDATAGPTGTPEETETPFAPRLVAAGDFVGADDFHFGRGDALLIETAPAEYVVRFEDFSVRNGPALRVYLSTEPDDYSEEALDLGDLKATDGNYNNEVPSGADISRYRSVIIWCEQFSVLFAYARFEEP